MNLPIWYKKGVPRVSELVSFVFPFNWNSKERYLKWLREKNINEPTYLTTSQKVWTYIHQHMEDYINWVDTKIENDKENEKVKACIEWWKEYIDTIKETYTKQKGRKLVAEPHLLDKENRWQGSSDLVLINEKKKRVIIIDWKSFWIAKSFFSLPNNYKKPYDKIKKWALQFSYYWEVYKQQWYEVEKLILVYLHHEWAFAYELEQKSTEELETIYYAFKAQKENSYFPNYITMDIKAPLKIHLQTAPQPYQNVSVELDLKELDSWITAEDAINEAVRVQKTLHNNYIKMNKDGSYNVKENNGN